MEQQQTSPFSPGNIAVTLSELPGRLYESDVYIARLESALAELEESLDLAKTNASLNATDDGKAEDKRKLQRAAAAGNDPEVQRLSKLVRAKREEIEIEKANNKQLSREFAGMCHIAEMKSNQMLLTAKGVTLK